MEEIFWRPVQKQQGYYIDMPSFPAPPHSACPSLKCLYRKGIYLDSWNTAIIKEHVSYDRHLI